MNNIKDLERSVDMEKGIKFCINTRRLYEFLGTPQNYRTWIKQRLLDTNALENHDYIVSSEFRRNSGVFASAKPMFLVKVNERSNNIVANLADHLCEKLIKMFKEPKKNTTQSLK